MKRRILVAVIGGRDCSEKVEEMAIKLGEFLAKVGVIIINGGLNGIMEAVSKGAEGSGGITIGILSSGDKNDANPYISIPLATGLGEARNAVIASSADILIALPGEYGTLSEIAFALRLGKPVVGIGSWDIKGMIQVNSAEEAVEKVKNIIHTGSVKESESQRVRERKL